MRVLVCLLSFALIGACYGQDYCPANATGCQGCGSRWDYNSITSESYVQANDKCTLVFSWPFEYEEADSNPWLKFSCEYFETGGSCNSIYDTTCASCLSYIITDIDPLQDPHVFFYDSCNNYFDMPVTQQCVNAKTTILTTYRTKTEKIESTKAVPTVHSPVSTTKSTTYSKTTQSSTSFLPITASAKPYCSDYHECNYCPENYTIPSFTQYADVHGNGECSVTFTWEYPYDEDIRMEFLCYYITGDHCHKEEPYVCGSCKQFTIHNIKAYDEPIMEYLDSCENRRPLILTQDCYELILE